MSDLVKYIHQKTAERGYVKDWTQNQFVARQLLLLIAEAAELAEHIDIGGLHGFDEKQTFFGALADLGHYANEIFKDKNAWHDLDCFITNHEAARIEAADCAIVAANVIAALNGDEQDIRRKASQDVSRGTNYTDAAEPLPKRPRGKDRIRGR